MAEKETQVVVVGAGNAAMCAAVAAAQRGAKVTVLEKAPIEHRGGNSALTGSFRFPYDSVEDLKPLFTDISDAEIKRISDMKPEYSQADFYDNIMYATEGRSDPELAHILVTQSLPAIRWLRSLGQDWVLRPLEATADHSSAPVILNGGGLGLVERLYTVGESMGMEFMYEARATELLQDSQGQINGVRILTPQGYRTIHARAVVLACGGFEGNAEMRAQYLGANWDTVKMRGVPFNTGDGLNMALDIGALPYGSWSSCHASPQDLNRPPYSLPQSRGIMGEHWTRYSYPFSIMVNIHGRRFVDEGERQRGLTYAKMGRAIINQPGSLAFQIFDAKCRELNLLVGYENATGVKSNTPEGVAEELGIDKEGLLRTVREYNEAVQPGEFSAFHEDGKGTVGINPPKSNFALTIDKPPFEGYAVVSGITFTFGGLKIDEGARVIHTLDLPIPGLYTAGEMVGGLFHGSYPGGSGMMAGAVFGKIAGASAADYALGL